MKSRNLASIIAALATIVIALPMCGGNSVANCVAGQSTACTGNAGCSGSQVCGSDGTYGACDCGSADGGVDSSPVTDGSPVNDSNPTDSPSQDVADDAADAASFSVLSIPGLGGLARSVDGHRLRHAADGCVLKRWLDQSGNSNDVTVTNLRRPVLRDHRSSGPKRARCDHQWEWWFQSEPLAHRGRDDCSMGNW